MDKSKQKWHVACVNKMLLPVLSLNKKPIQKMKISFCLICPTEPFSFLRKGLSYLYQTTELKM